MAVLILSAGMLFTACNNGTTEDNYLVLPVDGSKSIPAVFRGICKENGGTDTIRMTSKFIRLESGIDYFVLNISKISRMSVKKVEDSTLIPIPNDYKGSACYLIHGEVTDNSVPSLAGVPEFTYMFFLNTTKDEFYSILPNGIYVKQP